MALISHETRIANIKEQEQSVLGNINSSNKELSIVLKRLSEIQDKCDVLNADISKKEDVLKLINTQIVSRNNTRAELDKRLFKLNEDIDNRTSELNKMFNDVVLKINAYKSSVELDIQINEDKRDTLVSKIISIEDELKGKLLSLNEYRESIGESVKDITDKYNNLSKLIDDGQLRLDEINKKIVESELVLKSKEFEIKESVLKNSKVYEYLEQREVELDKRERDIRVIEERQERMKQMGGINFLRKQK